MKIGRLFIGWHRLSERDRIDLGLEAWLPGWEGLFVEWADAGYMILARPIKVPRG